MSLRSFLVLFLLAALPSPAANAATVWTGPDLLVSQPSDAGGTVTDVIVPGIASLGRGEAGPFCNTEGGDLCGQQVPGPSDLEFAFSGQNGNASFAYGSAGDFASLVFGTFQTATSGSPSSIFPNSGLGASRDPVPGVVHIVSLDVYFDIEISLWGPGRFFPEPGAFSYRRSTVPEPGTGALLALGLFGLAHRRPRR